ncbi:hypothetical protein NTE_00509 [Candidatus Nitrososphaera evergladensis SR1]|uniref:Uncharacterized protein n=2 Tax=Nitrososphaera TaxID=497726 RepID=A0A075MN64_9ARCH|nr:hypothetical protein NTE_00509 [Candidatus Nitrososphaera evergladensis SR1]
MFDKWVGKLMEGGSRVYAGMSSKHESISEEEEKEEIEKFRTELAEMKLKVRTNPQEVEEWFDKANRFVHSTQDKQQESSTSTTSDAAPATEDNSNYTNNTNTAYKENNHISANVIDVIVDDNNNDDYYSETGGQAPQKQQIQEEQQNHRHQQEQELTELLEESAEIALDKISQLTITAKDRLSPIARSGISQLNVFKEEGNDLKKLLSSKEIIIYKTDAIAIMLRKYGGIIEFLDAYDKLIREGYVLDHSEPIESFFFEIPINGIKTRLGKLYYFHHRKYTAAAMPPFEPSPSSSSATAVTDGGRDDNSCKKYVAAVFLKGSTATTATSSTSNLARGRQEHQEG